jgi:mono/diheme cytochrome c family protein
MMRPNVNSFASMIPKLFSTSVLLTAAILAFFLAANPQSKGDALNGKMVFEKVGCSRCHGSSGEGMPANGKEAGPPKIAGTHFPLQDFVQSVRKPKGQMPPFGAKQVSDAELSDVYAFLQSGATQTKLEIPPTANGDSGQRLYVSYGCYECHGYQGQGSVQTGGSRLGPPQIPYSGFVAYVRQPTGQMPPYASRSVSDAQLADIYVFLQSRPQAQPAKNIPLLQP